MVTLSKRLAPSPSIVLASIFAFALAVPGVSSAANDFFRTWGGPAGGVTTFALGGCRMTGENIGTTGYRIPMAVPPPGAQAMVIGRADDFGNPIWLQSVDFPPNEDFGVSITETANTDLATAGYTLDPATGLSNMLLTRFTRAGAPVYVRTMGTPAGDDIGIGCIEDPSDGGLIVCGASNSFTPGYAATVFKMSPAGVMTWGWTYGGPAGFPFSEAAIGITRLMDGNFAVTGWTQSGALGGAAQDMLTMVFSPAGALLWVRTLGFGAGTTTQGRSVVDAGDGTFYVVGITQGAGGLPSRDMFVARYVNAGGGPIGGAVTLGTPAEDFANSVTLTDNGLAIAGYSMTGGMAEQARVTIYDPATFTVVGSQIFGAAGTDEFRSVMRAGDGRLMFAGRTATNGPGIVNLLYGAIDPALTGCLLMPGAPLAVAFPPIFTGVVAGPVAAPFVIGLPLAAPVIGPPPTVSTPNCAVASTLMPYLNRYDIPATAIMGNAIAEHVGTGGAVTGEIAPSAAAGNRNWFITRFDPNGNVMWMRSYAYNGTSSDIGVGIARSMGQGWLSVAITQDGPNPPYPLAIRTDDNGVLLQRRRITGVFAVPSAIIATTDLGAAISGWTLPAGPSAAFVTKLNSVLAYQWTAEVTAAGRLTRARAIRQVADGGYLLGGTHQDVAAGGAEQMLIVKLNGAGGLVWSQALNLGAGFTSTGTAVTEKANGNYVVAGYETNMATAQTSALVAEFTAAGAFVRFTRMSGVDVDEVTGVDARGDSLVICGRSLQYVAGEVTTVAKIDPSGQVVWLRALQEAGNSRATGVSVSDGGDIQLVGSIPLGNLMIAKLNALGAACRSVSYLPFYTQPGSMFFDPGLGSTIVARTNNTLAMLETDETPTVTNCPAAVTAVDPTLVPMRGELELEVTSPARSTLQCRIRAAHAMSLRISLFDVVGRRVAGAFSLGELPAGPNLVRVPIGALRPGVYTALIEGGAVRARDQFVSLGD